MNKYLFLLTLFIIIVSCKNKSEFKSEKSFCYLSDDILFEYSRKNILINGTINDTIPIIIFFDTDDAIKNGYIAISDSFRIILGDKKFPLKINNKTYTIDSSIYMNRNNNFLKSNGQNTIIIGWRFFEQKIIKISYKNKYIRELHNTDELKEYFCIPVKHNALLEVQAEIFLQGKQISEKLIIDTGFFGKIEMGQNKADKYAINLNDSSVSIGKSYNYSYNRWEIEVDSIIIGNTIPNKSTVFFSEHKGLYSRGGLLGNTFLENFEVVLDLINFNLYLKSNE